MRSYQRQTHQVVIMATSAKFRYAGTFLVHKEDCLCLPLGSVGSFLGKATSTTDYQDTVKQTNKQANIGWLDFDMGFPRFQSTEMLKHFYVHSLRDSVL